MTIELSLLLSGVSLAFAVYFGLKNNARAEKNETRADALQLATVMTKLEEILRRLDELKEDSINKGHEIKDIVSRVVRLEEWRCQEEKVRS